MTYTIAKWTDSSGNPVHYIDTNQRLVFNGRISSEAADSVGLRFYLGHPTLVYANQFICGVNNNYGLGIANNNPVSFSTGIPVDSPPDTYINRDASGVIGLRNGTTPHGLNIYNTYTDDSNWERAMFEWDNDAFYIKATGLGTGSNRNIYLGVGSIDVHIQGKLKIGESAQVGGTTAVFNATADTGLYIRFGTQDPRFLLDGWNRAAVLPSDWNWSWSNTSYATNGTQNAQLRSPQANTLSIRNESFNQSGQAFYISNFYTDASNNAYGMLSWQRVPDTFLIGSATEGTGILRDVSVSGANIEIYPSGNGDVAVGTSSSEIGFFGVTPTGQPASGTQTESNFIENAGGTAINVDSTFGGYTLQQMVQALQDLGILS